MNLSWPGIVERAAQIVESYDTRVTLRQLFYRLVSEQLIPNTTGAYKVLSGRTAAARRAGTFPRLLDRTRQIHRDMSFTDPAEALEWLPGIYRRDRTEGQRFAVYLGVEKHGIVEQLRSWFGDYGLRVLSLGGYASQTYVDDILDDLRRDREADERPAVLIYAGDFDASGEDIDRDFLVRCDLFAQTVRVALMDGQVKRFNLPENTGKKKDTRAAGFKARHGRLVQVELDALEPETLRSLYAEALADFVDLSTFEAAKEREEGEREVLRRATI